MASFGRDRDTVSAEDLDAAIQELQWVEFASSTNRMRILKLEPCSRRTTPAAAPTASR